MAETVRLQAEKRRFEMPVPEKSGSEKGFTLVEILIALFIAALVMAGVVGVFQTFTRHTTSQDLLIETQQNARAGINFIQKDIALLGHRVPFGISSSLITADANEIEFRFVDPLAEDVAEENIKVRYAVNANNELTKQRCVQGTDWDLCPESQNRVVIENLPGPTALAFTYYDSEGQPLSPLPLSAANRGNVRFVKVSLTTETSEKLPTLDPPEKRSYEVHTEVRLRNIEIAAAPADVEAPSQPTGLQAREVDMPGGRGGICGRLKLRWIMGPEPDISGYRVFYTIGITTKSVTVPLSQLTNDGTYYYYTLAPVDPSTGNYLLTSTLSTDASASTYTIGIRAYDSSANTSVLSAEVTGNSNLFDNFADTTAAADDTTINPSKPDAVTGFIGADGTNEGQVALSWSYDLTNNPDVVGFRIYRNTTSFTTFPIAEAGNLKWIAGAAGEGKPNTLGSSATTFTDSDASLIGCETYYYAIAPVNCDPALITDEGSDPDEKKYVQTDYAITYGDGGTDTTQTGGDAGGADDPDGSDTTPSDETGPSSPTLSVRAGWKRVAVSLTQPSNQPSNNDFSQTCVYTNSGSDYPALYTDTETYPLTDGCYQIDTDTTTGARFVPDSGGIYTVGELALGESESFWHDSMTSESPASPELAETGTYSYRTVSFDRCGNASSITGAQATTILCGEDPPLCADAPAGTYSPYCANTTADLKPPAVSNADADCCDAASGVTLTWTGVSSDLDYDSTNTNPYDLAGYRIFRSISDDATGWDNATLLNTEAPFWGESYPDTGTTDGETYYYRIVSVDCPYEKNDPTEATIRTDMNNGTLKYAQVGPVSPGKIVRDEQCPGAGDCIQDLHREVFTGVSTTSTNATAPSSSFRHNTVTLFLENTSADTQTIQRATVKWVNPLAYLRKITIGGGRTPVTVTYTNIAQADTNPTTESPYTRIVSDYDITDAQIDAGERYVPITLEFKDVSGSPVDMRGTDLAGDEIVHITLDLRNDSTAKTGCLTYLTTNESDTGIVIPAGPEVTGVQQDNPLSTAYAVPGSSGNTVPTDGTSYGPVVATGGTDVNVSVNVFSNTTHGETGNKVGISSATLYWAETGLTDGDATDGTPTFSNSTSMTNTGGNTWEGTIPAVASPPSRVWFYVVAIDDDGNYDRSPEIDEGYYTYDQKPFDPCDVTPSTPSSLTGTWGLKHTEIYWPRVTTYTNTNSIDTGVDPIVYQVWRRDTLTGSYSKVYEVPDNAPATYTNVSPVLPADPYAKYKCDATYCWWYDRFEGLLGLNVLDETYYVVAENSCDADSNTSGNTNVWRECEGSTSAVITISPTEITSGDSYTVTVSDCQLSTDTNLNSITVNNNADLGGSYDLSLTETSSKSGLFTGTIATAISGADLNVAPTASTADTVTVSCSVGCSGTPSSQTVTVNASPCDYVPSAPSNLADNGSAGAWDRLQWDRNTEADVTGYNLYRSTDNVTYSLVIFVPQEASGPITYSYKPGTANLYYYVKAVDSCSLESGESNRVGPL